MFPVSALKGGASVEALDSPSDCENGAGAGRMKSRTDLARRVPRRTRHDAARCVVEIRMESWVNYATTDRNPLGMVNAADGLRSAYRLRCGRPCREQGRQRSFVDCRFQSGRRDTG